MDVLASQASAVSVERVFSAAADTDDPDRNRMQAELWEALEICKFSTRQRRTNPLDFTSHNQSLEEDFLLLEDSS
jgi:hypothetical protein